MTHGLAGETLQRLLPHRLLLAGGTPLPLAQEIARAGVRSTRTIARSCLDRLEESLRFVDRGLLEVPVDAGLGRFLVSGGKLNTKPILKAPLTLGELLKRYRAEHPDGVKESSTRSTKTIQIAHFLRLIDSKTTVPSVTTATLQSYVNARATELGRSGRAVSHVTIQEEIGTLSSVCNRWARPLGLLNGPAPTNGVIYAKVRAKPLFQTWEQIVRQLARGALSALEANELWGSLFLTLNQVQELRAHVRTRGRTAMAPRGLLHRTLHGRATVGDPAIRIDDLDFDAGTITNREKERDRAREMTFRSDPTSAGLKEVLRAWLQADQPGGLEKSARHIICMIWELWRDGPPLSLESPKNDTHSSPGVIDEEESLAHGIRGQPHRHDGVATGQARCGVRPGSGGRGRGAGGAGIAAELIAMPAAVVGSRRLVQSSGGAKVAAGPLRLPEQPRDRRLPRGRLNSEPHEDRGDSRMKVGLLLADQSARPVHQPEIARQRTALDHPRAAALLPAQVIQRQQPRISLLRRIGGQCREVVADRLEGPVGPAVVDPRAQRRVLGILGRGRDSGGQGVQVDVGGRRQQALLVEHGHAPEPALPEGPRAALLPVRHSRQRLLQALHEPAEVGEAFADLRHPGAVGGELADAGLGGGKGLAGDIADGEEGQPSPRDIPVGPVGYTLGTEPQENVQVIVHDGEAGAVDGKEADEFLETGLDPILAMGIPLAAEKSLAHAS
jgi:hypothetical protein